LFRRSQAFRTAFLLWLLVPVLVSAGCGGSGQTSLAKLANNHDAYLGKQVSTSGRLEAAHKPSGSRYYVLSDPARDLVALLPSSEARRFAGEVVVVTGRFGFDPRNGRVVHIERISLRG
jgi:hypothetical protein